MGTAVEGHEASIQKQDAFWIGKNGRFTRDEITALRNFAAERQFDLAWYPGIGGDVNEVGTAARLCIATCPNVNSVAISLCFCHYNYNSTRAS